MGENRSRIFKAVDAMTEPILQRDRIETTCCCERWRRTDGRRWGSTPPLCRTDTVVQEISCSGNDAERG